MKRISSIIAAAVLISGCAGSGKIFTEGEIIRLYEEQAPGYGDVRVQEVNIADKVLFNVQDPTLQVFPAENPNGTAVLVVPGGGFCMLSYWSEGADVAKELNKKGITAFVLKYRLNPMIKDDGEPASNLIELVQVYQNTYLKDLAVAETLPEKMEDRISYQALHTPCSPLAFEDADNAMRYIRSHAKEFGIKNLGMVGFSAGAMITLHQILDHQEDTRPDFAGVIYGGWYEPLDAPQDAMPLFLSSPVHDVFAPEESWWVYKAWRSAGAPVEKHDFSKTEHGYGADKDGSSKDSWIDLFCSFLNDYKLI
ncbi:MAG: alpha/beta hydrolase [Bacteroidales bacterium]|nr:alpha/beta hydrolase [Bacteroidales bacterium]